MLGVVHGPPGPPSGSAPEAIIGNSSVSHFTFLVKIWQQLHGEYGLPLSDTSRTAAQMRICNFNLIWISAQAPLMLEWVIQTVSNDLRTNQSEYKGTTEMVNPSLHLQQQFQCFLKC